MNYCNSCNIWYSGGFCNQCYQPSCNNTCAPSVPNCGCISTVLGTCAYFNSATTPCLGIAKGQTYDSIITAIDAKICTITSSGAQTVYNVQGTANQIDVSSSLVSGVRTFTASLDSVITNQLSTQNSQIAALQSILGNSITSITTSTPSYLGITNPSQGVVNINYTPVPILQSKIVTNDNLNIQVSAGTQTVLTKNINFNTAASATTGDTIQFYFTLQAGVGDNFSILVYNGTTSQLIYNPFIIRIGAISSWSGLITFNLTSATTATVKSEFESNASVNEFNPLPINMGSASKVSQRTTDIRAQVQNIDLTNVKVIFQVTNSGTNNAIFGEFISSINKKI